MHDEHIPVLLQESIQGLQLKEDGIYVDGTFGRGGHSKEILANLGANGRLIAFDKDKKAIEKAQTKPFQDSRFKIFHGSFAELKAILEAQGLLGKVDGILLDLGVSSPQLDDAKRGFSFLKEGPLDMRMNEDQPMSAATWINHAKESEIALVLREYGEERFAKRIANAIVKARAKKALSNTAELAEIIKVAHPRWERRIHPATRSFQGIRIFINRELEDLKAGLVQGLDVLAPKGRLCVISFHSLEDRIVKKFIQKQSSNDEIPPDLPIKAQDLTCRLKKVGGLIRPSEQEVQQNPRARSARLRIAEKIK